MTQKQFSILIGVGVFCALLFAAPGLYRLSKDYQRDKARAEASMPKDERWAVTSRSAEYQALTLEKRAEVKALWFEQCLLPEIESKPRLKEIGREKMLNWFMQQPDDNGQSYFVSFVGSSGRGVVAILPWCFDGIATWQISPDFTEFAESVRGGIESFCPVNPIHAEKWQVKMAFWLGFSVPPAAFFVIRARRKKVVATAPPAAETSRQAEVRL